MKSILNKFARLISLVFLPSVLLPGLAHAHPGHSALGSFAHQFEHQLWLAAGLLALAIGVAKLIQHKMQARQKSPVRRGIQHRK